MREIKFRAWDKNEKIMLGVMNIFELIETERPFKTTEFKENDEIGIMQFTGLKDKNGKEIFEGDVLKQGEGGKMTLAQIMGTQAFGFCFMVLIIGIPIYALIHELFFRDKYPTVKARKGIV